MLTRLSSKGQQDIPKDVRPALWLCQGSQLHIELGDGKIILEPIGASAIEALYGKYAGSDLLADLEAEHEQEIRDENAVRA